MILFFLYFTLLEEGIDLYKKGEFDNALKKVERFILNEKGDSNTIPLALYLSGKLSKKEDKAIKYYDELIKKYPNNKYTEEAIFEKAQYWYAKNDFIKAISGYKDIIMLYPKGKYASIARNYIKLISEFVFVQLGYFSQKNNAYKLAKTFPLSEKKIYILEDKSHYRVWCGIFSSREEAKKFISDNKIEGIIKQIK